MMDWFGGQKNANFTSEIHLCIFFYRFPEPKAHTFILEFILLESTYYAEANKRVAFILDIMKLDVPDLFCDQRGDTSILGESFKKNLHSYIASRGLSRDLLKCVNHVMVSCEIRNSSNIHTPGWTTSKAVSLSEIHLILLSLPECFTECVHDYAHHLVLMASSNWHMYVHVTYCHCQSNGT